MTYRVSGPMLDMTLFPYSSSSSSSYLGILPHSSACTEYVLLSDVLLKMFLKWFHSWSTVLIRFSKEFLESHGSRSGIAKCLSNIVGFHNLFKTQTGVMRWSGKWMQRSLSDSRSDSDWCGLDASLEIEVRIRAHNGIGDTRGFGSKCGRQPRLPSL